MLAKTGMIALALAVAAGLTGCVDDDGYGGVAAGYAPPPVYYGDGYDGAAYPGGYGDVGYGGPSYFGWYGDFYYPGAGIYVYHRDRRPYRWNGDQQRYWNGRSRYRDRGYDGRGNWGGFAMSGGYHRGVGADRADGAGRGRPVAPGGAHRGADHGAGIRGGGRGVRSAGSRSARSR